MSKEWNYRPGEWYLLCDVCGKKMKSSSARHRWDGLIVCDEDFEHRHSQDFIKVRQDKITVPFTRPRPEDVFIHVCNEITTQGEADYGTADCARADTTFGYRPVCSWLQKGGNVGAAVVGCSIVGNGLEGYI